MSALYACMRGRVEELSLTHLDGINRIFFGHSTAQHRQQRQQDNRRHTNTQHVTTHTRARTLVHTAIPAAQRQIAHRSCFSYIHAVSSNVQHIPGMHPQNTNKNTQRSNKTSKSPTLFLKCGIQRIPPIYPHQQKPLQKQRTAHAILAHPLSPSPLSAYM